MSKIKKTSPPKSNPLTAEIALRRSARPGDVVLGGLFSRPHLSVGYINASRTVLASTTKRAPDLLPPVFYLLRHSVELALKDLLWANHENMVTQGLIDHHDGKVATPAIPAPKWIAEIKRTHNLSTILGWLRDDIPVYVTSAWEDLVTHIDRYEKGSPEWARYDDVRDPADKKKSIKSFQEPRLVDIETLLAEAEAFIKDAAQIRPLSPSDKEWSALQDLCLTAQSLTDQLNERGLL